MKQMKIGYLGAGSWGFTLACLLGSKGHEVTLWSQREEIIRILNKQRKHPKIPHYQANKNVIFSPELKDALEGMDLVIESVSSSGLRPVLEQVLALNNLKAPLVITSKGIEQNSGLLLPEVAVEVLGENYRARIGCLSGPSLADEVIHHLPTSIVAAAYDPALALLIQEAFTTQFFRVYPNSDLNGVAFGGAMKNIIAIACGLSDGLGFGDNTKAALMTRGLHEIRKLSSTKQAKIETLNGLSGMGDLCVTCLSKHSRNYSFGRLIAEGLDPDSAKERIGMVVEGAYTCVSARQLARGANIEIPITDAIYSILYEGLSPLEAVKALLQRTIKEEHL